MNLSLLELARLRTVLFDGAMGTELMRRGLERGTAPEAWNLERPEAVREVHADYFSAGADVVSTNSFGGSPLKLSGHGLAEKAFEINRAAARLAREAAPPGRFVAGSMGPTGRFLKPQGDGEEADFEAAYTEQARGLAEGGADLILIETQYDLREALAALRGARRGAPGLPVFVTMTFNAYPRGYFTLMGDSVEKAVAALEREGVEALGANCTLNSGQMVGCVRALTAVATVPVLAQANAGQPILGGDGSISYSQGLEDYVRYVPEIVRAGASMVGGCCGTTPETIRAMARALAEVRR